MTTEAQKRATKRYREKMKGSGYPKRLYVEFWEKDIDLYEYLQIKRNKAAYIKGLIMDDMHSKEGDADGLPVPGDAPIDIQHGAPADAQGLRGGNRTP